MGTLLKIDTCTASTTRGRYARLCVQVPLDQPLQHHVYIGCHKQAIHYKGFNLLCTPCGRLGHQLRTYPYSHRPSSKSNDQSEPLTRTEATLTPEWKVVQFKSTAKANRQPPNSQHMVNSNKKLLLHSHDKGKSPDKNLIMDPQATALG